MKLYSGSLKDYIFDRTVSINANDTYKIAQDVARGGAHIHSFDVVHFDIKPLNVLVDYDASKGGFNCCITDFGVKYIFIRIYWSGDS